MKNKKFKKYRCILFYALKNVISPKRYTYGYFQQYFLKIIILEFKRETKFLPSPFFFPNYLRNHVLYIIFRRYRKLFWLLLHPRIESPHDAIFPYLTLNRSSVIRPYKKLEISWQAALSAKLFRKLDTIFVRACTSVRLHSVGA